MAFCGFTLYSHFPAPLASSEGRTFSFFVHWLLKVDEPELMCQDKVVCHLVVKEERPPTSLHLHSSVSEKSPEEKSHFTVGSHTPRPRWSQIKQKCQTFTDMALLICRFLLIYSLEFLARLGLSFEAWRVFSDEL